MITEIGTVASVIFAAVGGLITVWSARTKRANQLEELDLLELYAYRKWRPMVLRAWGDLRAKLAAADQPDPGDLPEFVVPKPKKIADTEER